jgi:serine/threonine protein kinase
MIRSGILADEGEVRRFYTEAQAAARLRHRGIVGVHQFGRRAGHHFFSMEFIPGTDLQKRVNAGLLDPKEAARYVRDVARAIHHAHQKGVLHRDLKPANVLSMNMTRFMSRILAWRNIWIPTAASLEVGLPLAPRTTWLPNKPVVTVIESAPRVTFTHWVPSYLHA